MTSIRFGPLYSRLHTEVPIPEFAPAVEDMGFDAVWVGEGLVNELAHLDVIVALQSLADHTRHVRIGTCVVILPLRSPVILAKEVASVDVLSGGRVILGIGAGGSGNSARAGFDACGVPLSERGPRTDEALAVMTSLWTGKAVSHTGRFHSFDHISMEPCPRQQPHPPLWAGGGTAERILRRTAQWCNGWVPTDLTPDEYAAGWNQIERYAAELDRSATDIVKALHIYLSLDDDRTRAKQVAQRTLTDRYGIEATLRSEHDYAFGTPDDCIDTIRRFAAVGVTDVVLNVTRPLPEVLGQLRRFRLEVMPHFR